MQIHIIMISPYSASYLNALSGHKHSIDMHVICAGQVELDQEVCKQLLQTGHFQQMQLDVDEVIWQGFMAASVHCMLHCIIFTLFVLLRGSTCVKHPSQAIV